MAGNFFKNETGNSLINKVQNAIFADMQTMAQKALNPENHHLSSIAKKRLNWMYELYHRQNGNISKTHRKLGISRQWLSAIKNEFEQSGKDPRSLEPDSRAPHDTSKRNRISKETENLILKVRKDSRNAWGKVKIARVLQRDYGVKVRPNTANNYLRPHKLINPKISLKNSNAWKAKKEREQNPQSAEAKWRPPKAVKDYAPGALVERDIKFIPIPGKQLGPGLARDNFWSQHTFIDSFTRIRVLELTAGHTATDAVSCRRKIQARLPFEIASENSDNGSENNGTYHPIPTLFISTPMPQLRPTIRAWSGLIYKNAKEIFITADCGGSNGYRVKLWKTELQKLANELNKIIHVSYFPPGTSKWNKIEHRLFCFISKNWRGVPLIDRASVVSLIGSVKTKNGLVVKAKLDKTLYQKGIKVSSKELEAVKMEIDKFHGEWNYWIRPS